MGYREEIEPLRHKLDHYDKGLLGLLSARAEVVEEVGRLKEKYGIGLQASDREASMFGRLTEGAEALGLDSRYVRDLWSLIIWNSKVMECRVTGRTTFMNEHPVPTDELRNNLLRLTAAVAPGYDEYCNGTLTEAIRAYRDREERAFKRALDDLGKDGRGLALDLGCASGQVTRYLEPKFDRVRAFDVSPDMIREAHARQAWQPHVSFEEVDLFGGIPVDDESVSFAIANFGAASEVCPNLASEIKRVLRPGGKALLSFYNRNALMNEWFYPWPATVHTRTNPHNDTVEVWAADSVFVVHAVSQTVDALKQTFPAKGRLSADFFETYPTFGGMLPVVFFQEPMYADYVQSVGVIDNHLARSSTGVAQGTYILTVVTKKP